jgi:hypothetical protein
LRRNNPRAAPNHKIHLYSPHCPHQQLFCLLCANHLATLLHIPIPEDHFLFGKHKRRKQYEAGTLIQCPSGARPEEGIFVDWEGRRAVVKGSRWYDDGDPFYEEVRRGKRPGDECIYLKLVYVLEIDGRQSPQFAQIDEVHLSWPDA